MNFFVPDRSSDESRRTENRNEQAREPPRGLTSRVGGGGGGVGRGNTEQLKP